MKKNLTYLFDTKKNELDKIKDAQELRHWFESFLKELNEIGETERFNTLTVLFNNYVSEQLVCRYSNEYIYGIYRILSKEYIASYTLNLENEKIVRFNAIILQPKFIAIFLLVILIIVVAYILLIL